MCLETTQIELEGWLSSPQALMEKKSAKSGPEGLCSREGKSGPEGLCSREGTDSLCWVCVGVLEARLVLV